MSLNFSTFTVIIVVDVGTGSLLEVPLLDEDDAQAVQPLIHEWEQRDEIQQWVSDEKDSYG